MDFKKWLNEKPERWRDEKVARWVREEPVVCDTVKPMEDWEIDIFLKTGKDGHE